MIKKLTKTHAIVQAVDETAQLFAERCQTLCDNICNAEDVNDGVQFSISAASDGRMTAFLWWHTEIDRAELVLKLRYRGVMPETLIVDTEMAPRLLRVISEALRQDLSKITVQMVADVGKLFFSQRRMFGDLSVKEIAALVTVAGCSFNSKTKQ